MQQPGHLEVKPRPASVSAWPFIVAGTLTALATAWFICQLPQWKALSWAVLASASLQYVLVVASAGAAGAWVLASLLHPHLYLHPGRSLKLGWLALNASVGWVLIPAVVLFLRQGSMWALFLAAAAAASMAGCVSKLVLASREPEPSVRFEPGTGLAMPEAGSPAPRSRPWYASMVSILLHGAAVALLVGSLASATVLLALSAFLLGLRMTATDGTSGARDQHTTHAAVRLALVAVIAVFITSLALLPWSDNGRLASAIQTLFGWDQAVRGDAVPKIQSATDHSFQSIILWPVPKETKRIVVPPVSQKRPWPLGRIAEVVIPFDGSYWYFKEPSKSPGPKAHRVRGNPLTVKIHSADWQPLTMEAHQVLGASIDLRCCREIQVRIQNGDDRPGRMAVELLLTDSASAGMPSQSLGAQPVVSTAARRSSDESSPAEETLEFAMPAHAKISRFDEITVVFLPATERSLNGAKIAIKEFILANH